MEEEIKEVETTEDCSCDCVLQCDKEEVRNVVFTATITDETDENGNFKINFTYKRTNFPVEDLGKAMRALEAHIIQDIKGI